jgi:hypothetical protein
LEHRDHREEGFGVDINAPRNGLSRSAGCHNCGAARASRR